MTSASARVKSHVNLDLQLLAANRPKNLDVLAISAMSGLA